MSAQPILFFGCFELPGLYIGTGEGLDDQEKLMDLAQHWLPSLHIHLFGSMLLRQGRGNERRYQRMRSIHPIALVVESLSLHKY